MAVDKSLLALKRLMCFPNDLLFFLTRDGDWKLRFPTDQIIGHLLTALPAPQADLIRQQLAQPLVQHWWHKGRINPIFHYVLDPDSVLQDEAFQKGLYQVEMLVDGKKQNANVKFVAGRLYSVELPQPFKFYRGKTITFGEVKRGKSSQSYTRALDRLEHGKGEGT